MEIINRDEHEDEMLIAFLALWTEQRKRFVDDPAFWDRKVTKDRELLLFWLAFLFVESAKQHGLSEADAREVSSVWAGGHSVLVLSGMSRHTQRLLGGKSPEESIFGEARAKRMVVTEVTDAQSAGSDYAKEIQGLLSPNDLWYAANPLERRCPYCGRLHLKPRSEWKEIYYTQILPNNPELAIYGEPNRPRVHPHCNCFILYVGESSDDRS